MGVEGAMVMFMFTTSFTPPPTGYTDSSPSKLNLPLEPSGVTAGLLAFQRLEGLEISQRVVGGKGQTIEGLDTGDVGLHIVAQGGGFQHFGFAAEVRKLLNVDQLAPLFASVGFLHQKNLHFYDLI